MKIEILPLFRLPLIRLALTACIGLAGCGDADQDAPADEVLLEAPFAALTDSIRQAPRNDVYYFHRAVLLNKSSLSELALADFQKAWSLRGDEKYAFGIANIWLDRSPDSAVVFLRSALNRLPESYLLRVTLARAEDALGKTDEALSTARELLQQNPAIAEGWLIQADLLGKKQDAAGSLQSLEKAYELAPANLEIAFKLMYALAEAKNKRALSLCDTLIRQDTGRLHADPYYVKGLYYSNTGENAQAIHWFDETIRHDINYLNAYIEKGKILLNEKKITEAQPVFELANRVKPAFPDAYYWIGVCQEARGQKEEALLNYQKAYGLDKSFTEAREAADRLSK